MRDVRRQVALRITLLCALAATWPCVAFGQASAPPATGTGPEFFPRYDFHLTAEHLSSDDRRFVWDTNFGGELDLVRVDETRLTFVANYQAMLGEQLRRFDPNQGNYILAGSLTTMVRGFEVGPVFYHQSRHLSDRFKRDPIDWNMLGGRLVRRVEQNGALWEGRVDLRRTIQKSLVDYEWELDAGLRGRYDLRSRVALVGGGFLRRLSVDGTRQRAAQTGGKVDVGVRFQGTGGAIELFVAAERRIDPFQPVSAADSWASVGMRLLSR